MLTRTTTAMLEALLDPADDEVWRDFDHRYRPILVAFARRLGLPAEDAADAAQETLTRFVRSYRDGKYDRDRGRLRSWIIGIARHCVYDIHQRRATDPKRGMSAISELPDESTINAMWDEECEHEILRQGISELRQQTRTEEGTIRAFEMLAFDGRTPAEVAKELSISVNDVYLAKHRCLKRLREILGHLKHLYEVA
ncbi:MAG: sigma-70 family RNA polymerase sigma factor [Planctomycetes bacterium]|nr:sigma-70 family RNA polymerase sigma factor [Planctomycetota bacterium]